MNKAATGDKLALRDLDRQLPAPAPVLSPDAVEPGSVGAGSVGAGSVGVGSVGVGSKVTLHFALKLADQQLIDSNFDSSPASVIIGSGDMLPGFERVLLGKKAGDTIEALIPAAEAFGVVNPDNQQRFPHFRFPPDLALTENLMIEFTDAGGYKQAGRVTSIGKQYVEIDFNHPLAGRDIVFTATIHNVEPRS